MELNQFKRILRQVLILPVVALLLLAGVLLWQFHGSNTTVGLIDEADQQIALATLIERLVVDEETGLRGYETTGDPQFLQPYHDSDVVMDRAISTLESMPDTGQGTLLKQFSVDHRTWHDAFAQPLVAIVGSGGQVRDVELNLKGKSLMDAMRRDLNQIALAAQQRHALRTAQWHSQVRFVLTALIVLAVGVGVFIGLFTRDRLEAVSLAFRRSLELQRRRSDQLFQSEQRLRTTLSSIGDGVIACDAEGQIQMMNVVAQELTGWTETEAQGKPLVEVFHIVEEATREPLENPVAKVKRLDRIVGLSNHTILLRKDGTELNIDDSGAPIRDQAGVLTGVVLVFRDITVERRTRSALLANEKLAVAGRLAATIAHEIHNPLDSVSNLLYLLQSGSTEEESRQFLHMAQSELARVTQISRAMLSLYRESKAPVPIDLKLMLEDLLLLMERRFHDLGATVVADLPDNVTIDGFPAELRQVFNNLITNAAEAAAKGGSVRIRVLPQSGGVDSNGGKLEPGATVEIVDDGPGISAEVREQLFQPFFTTKGERGTGLGLWVSQGIVRKHGGRLELRNHEPPEARGVTASVFLATKPTIVLGGD